MTTSEKLDNITLYNADCMDIMQEMPDNAFDLAIVDPPYGIGEANILKNKTRGKITKSKRYKVFSGKDAEPPTIDYFRELFRISRNQIIWGANYFISRIPRDSPCWIVWDKDNGENDFADCELAWTSFPTAVRRFKYKWQGMLQENMKNKEVRIHPTQKPVALYKWLLFKYAKECDKILDTHGGSMSSAIAAHDMGFEMTIIEKDPEYFAAARRRLQWHQAQQKLF